VVISRNVDQSEWVKWEINYATSLQTRSGRQSKRNGVVMAIDDGLIYNGNQYNDNATTLFVKSKADPVVVRVSDLLANTSYWVDEAFKNARKP
jgi:hypothetical protein